MVALPTAPTPQTVEESSALTGGDLEARVIVYNCNCHTYQQVIDLLCRAVPKMTPARAFELAYRIDHTGSAEVYEGPLQTCERIAAILADGGLRVAVQ
ncbi:MAG TPA: ATP-dependent Clp protease adaptor ClpS [Nitrospirales bacterium]|nr:ATP-dependent Clp protease adaptor ClpS [Nitrospirales bacterium]